MKVYSTQREGGKSLPTTPSGSIAAVAQLVQQPASSVLQRRMQQAIGGSPRIQQAAVLQRAIDAHAPARTGQVGTLPASMAAPMQRKANNTGLPDALKQGIENLSGYSLDDVRVHYNSDKPAQVQAHAYAQGTDIYLAPGQEKHLPHEAWHVVQQKQGRVRPTLQLKSKVNVNDNISLELEADFQGKKALQLKKNELVPVQKKGLAGAKSAASQTGTIQLAKEQEFINDPQAFMNTNQLLVDFNAGILLTYTLSPADIEKIKSKQEENRRHLLQQSVEKLANNTYTQSNFEYANFRANESVSEKTTQTNMSSYITTLFAEAQKVGNGLGDKTLPFTLAERKVSAGLFSSRKQYLVTPMLEKWADVIPDETRVNGPDGGKIRLKDALKALKRKNSGDHDAEIPAAFIPFTVHAEQVQANQAVLPTGDSNPGLQIAFTASMNGCSLVVAPRHNEDGSAGGLSAWHYPSPSSSVAAVGAEGQPLLKVDGKPKTNWDIFRSENNIENEHTFNNADYHRDAGPGQDPMFVTTVVMVRNARGWGVVAQQSRGPGMDAHGKQAGYDQYKKTHTTGRQIVTIAAPVAVL